jgi:hypothetical protein
VLVKPKIASSVAGTPRPSRFARGARSEQPIEIIEIKSDSEDEDFDRNGRDSMRVEDDRSYNYRSPSRFSLEPSEPPEDSRQREVRAVSASVDANALTGPQTARWRG